MAQRSEPNCSAPCALCYLISHSHGFAFWALVAHSIHGNNAQVVTCALTPGAPWYFKICFAGNEPNRPASFGFCASRFQVNDKAFAFIKRAICQCWLPANISAPLSPNKNRVRRLCVDPGHIWCQGMQAVKVASQAVVYRKDICAFKVTLAEMHCPQHIIQFAAHSNLVWDL